MSPDFSPQIESESFQEIKLKTRLRLSEGAGFFGPAAGVLFAEEFQNM